MKLSHYPVLFALCLWLLPQLSAADSMATASVTLKTIPAQYQFDGVVEAVNRATVASRIAAEVIEINVDVNDRVAQDQVILRFRDDEIKTRLMRAEANLLAEKAQYQEALARQKEAQAEAGRIADLFARKQVTRSALDKVEADKAAANARVNVLAAQIKAREAEVAEAKVALSYTVVQAPYAGIVTERLIEVGEMASPGQLLMSGVSLDSLRVVIQSPQRLLDDMLPARIANVETIDGKSLSAGEATLVPQADPASHSFGLRIPLLAQADHLYPGSSVKVSLEGPDETLLLVPAEAVVQRGEASAVYLLKNDDIQLRQVRPGRTVGSEREILAGLQAGDVVIIEPTQAVGIIKNSQGE